MNTKLKIVQLSLYAILLSGLIGCNHSGQKFNKSQQGGMKYILDMVHNNPGEEATVSKYIDPEFVKSEGYNGMVPQWHIQCGLTYDSFEPGIIPEGSKERQWILNKQKFVRGKLQVAEDAGMPVYAFTDVLVLPSIILEKYKDKIVRGGNKAGGLHAIHGKMVPDINQPLTQKLIRVQIDEIFKTFPQLDGLVIRFGETYLFDTPYHSGGCPVKRGGQEGIDGHVKLINILREEVCEKRDKKLFYRTWDFGNFFHTNPKVYLAITNRVEPHENLIFSVKHTKGDFFRTFIFNPTLSIGRHQQLVEVQCQREYEGKGAHPNYIAKSVIEGFEEYNYLMKPKDPKCLKDIVSNRNIVGVWTWSRGGGWCGPYISNELWIHLNAFVLSKWAQNPLRWEEDIFNEFASEIGIKGKDVSSFRELCLLSVQGVFKGRVSKYGKVNVIWTRDQYFYGLTKLQPFFDEVLKNHLEEKVIEEKLQGVDIWRKMEKLAATIHTSDSQVNEFLVISTKYGRIKYEIVANGWKALLLGLKGDKTGQYDKKRINEAIRRYDELWKKWGELKNESLLCPTLYYPDGFSIGNKGVSGNKKTGIGAAINKYRDL